MGAKRSVDETVRVQRKRGRPTGSSNRSQTLNVTAEKKFKTSPKEQKEYEKLTEQLSSNLLCQGFSMIEQSDWSVASLAPAGRYIFYWDRQATDYVIWILHLYKAIRKPATLDFAELFKHPSQPQSFFVLDIRPLSIRSLLVVVEERRTRRPFIVRMLMNEFVGRFKVLSFTALKAEDRLIPTSKNAYCIVDNINGLRYEETEDQTIVEDGTFSFGIIRERQMDTCTRRYYMVVRCINNNESDGPLCVYSIVDGRDEEVDLTSWIGAITRIKDVVYGLREENGKFLLNQLYQQSTSNGQDKKTDVLLAKKQLTANTMKMATVWIRQTLYVAMPCKQSQFYAIFALALETDKKKKIIEWRDTNIKLKDPVHALIAGDNDVLIVDTIPDAFTHEYYRFQVCCSDTLRNCANLVMIKDDDRSITDDCSNDWVSFLEEL
ncbi:hypothetical protein M3Y94_01242500 [Aphelenchoides besseyi]|nr:hypothetical protein M3Y94_01242500 [Aphelenchoides besseyi]KAI6217182.1 hypothetical protein M3Y95_01232100 [Aphelenchoides besseyi]